MITSQKASSPDREALSATSARHPRPGSESGAGSSGDPAVLGHSRAGGRHPRPGSESGAGSSGDQRLVVIPAQAGIQASSLFPRSRLKPSVRPLLFFLLLPQLGPCGLKRFESLLLGQHVAATLTPSPSGRGRGEGPTRHPRPGCCEEHSVPRIGVADPRRGQSPRARLLWSMLFTWCSLMQ